MNKPFKFLFIILFAAVVLIIVHVIHLTTLSAKEVYPEDNYLKSELEKTALIIVAHDDDMAGSSGTISMLCENGWKIREICFYQQGGLYASKDSIKNPVRKENLRYVAELQGMAGVDPVDFNFRTDMETEKSYWPMPYSDFNKNFMTGSLYGIIGSYIEKYKPAVIFTLDDIIGGYGHPDHVVISRIVSEYCRQHKSDTGFTVNKIYQSVFSPSLAEGVIGKIPVYIEGKKVYNCNGMPLPDVQLTISSKAEIKKEVMKSYITEQNSLRKIWPYYNLYPSWLYFRIFDREFFKVIEVRGL